MMPLMVFKVRDRSMEPGLREGDFIVVYTWGRKFRRGDIVVFPHPGTGMRMVKRVTRSGRDSCFVVGDNSRLSEDSRKFGDIRAGSIVGKVILHV